MVATGTVDTATRHMAVLDLRRESGADCLNDLEKT